MECDHCNNFFERRQKIDGEIKDLGSRKYCLDCSPFGSRGRRQLKTIEGEKELSYLKGVVESDGSLFKRDTGTYIFSLGVMDKDYAESTKDKLEKLGLESNINEYEQNGKTRYDIQKSCKKLYQKLKQMSHEDILPGPFLKGYFDGDGCISTTYNISATCKDKEVIDLVQSKLAEIGIEVNILELTGQKGYVSDYYKINFSSKDSLKKFNDHAGFSIQRKQERLDEALS